MSVSTEEVKYIAELARLEFADEDLDADCRRTQRHFIVYGKTG